MKEIVLKRNKENYSMANYKVVIENEPTIQIGNGETKKVQLDSIPVKLYAKQGWLKSRIVTIDNSTIELTLRNERVKNWIAPRIGGLVLIALLPRTIWSNSAYINIISIIGLSVITIWTIYAFVIRRNDWILIEKITTE